jgi:hypothetical protein
VDESEKHYTKCNNPVTKRQIPHDLTYIWSLAKLSSEVERKTWLPEARQREEGENRSYLLKGKDRQEE